MISSASWNSVVPAGGSVSFGFVASTQGDKIAEPTGIKVNGEGGDQPPPPPNGDEKFQVNAKATDVWEGGFNGQIEIVNQSGKPVTHWELKFASTVPIGSLWNGQMSRQGGVM